MKKKKQMDIEKAYPKKEFIVKLRRLADSAYAAYECIQNRPSAKARTCFIFQLIKKFKKHALQINLSTST